MDKLTQSATQINRQIRAFNPYPIAQTNATSDKFNEKTLRILSATAIHRFLRQRLPLKYQSVI